MTQMLRPMSLGEILDRTFQIYRARFLQFVCISAMPALANMAVYAAANAWLIRHPQHSGVLLFGITFSRLLWTTMVYASYAFVVLLFRPIFIRAASNAATGASFSVYKSLARTARLWRTMLALNLAQQAILIFVPASIFIACVAAIGSSIHSAHPGVAVMAAALLLLLLVSCALFAEFVWSGACVSLSFAAAELEDASWLTALKRSWRLSKKSRGRIIFTWFAVFAGTVVADFVLRWTVYFALRLLLRDPAFWNGLPSYVVTTSLPTALVSCVVGPIYPIALTLFYYDQRIRHEGYDIEQMMEAAGLNSTATHPIAEEPIAPSAPQEDHA
jgi:hypothetical protein